VIRVVGGGVAGLAAAYRLRGAGHEVTVHEAADRLGGLAATYETAGDDVEVFYHHLSKSEETIVELAADLGVDPPEWRVGKNAYYVDGVVHPLDTLPQIAAYPHLSLYDKFRLGMLVLGIDVRGGRPDFDAYDDLTAYEDVPVERFVVEHTSRGVYENFFEPLLDAKFGDRADDVSAAWLLGRVRFRGERDLRRGELLGYFDGGFAPLVRALVDAVGRDAIRTGERVTAIHAREGAVDGITVAPSEADPTTVEGAAGAALANGAGAGEAGGDAADATGATAAERMDADAVVVATMPNVLESLTGYGCPIDFQGAACALVTIPERLTDTYWLNVAHDAPFGALIEHTNFVPPERYGGDHLLYLASYVQSPDEWVWQADADALRERWLGHVGEMFPDFDPSAVAPDDFRLAKNPRAAPVYERGYLDTVIPYDVGGADPDVPAGVYYAGMASRAQYPERSLNGAVVAGFGAADAVLDG
jgi:protoporphyrinogen oxidase